MCLQLDAFKTILIAAFDPIQISLPDKDDPDAQFDMDAADMEEQKKAMEKFQAGVLAQMKTNDLLRTRMLKLVEEGEKYGYYD